jgi:DNA repair protein RecO (recombination protein O)
MIEIKTQAVVLSAADYKDADKRLALFSCEYGLIWATIKGVKKPKAKLASIAQPFCFAEFLLNKTGDFYSVINATAIDSFFDLTKDFDKYIVGTSLLEFIKKTTKENDPNLGLFVMFLKCLKILNYENANPMAVLIKFLIDGMGLIGYTLKMDKCACCESTNLLQYGYAYSYDYGGIICKKCSNGANCLDLTAGEQGVIKNIFATSIDDISRLKFSSREALVSIIGVLARQFRLLSGEELATIKDYL